MDIGKTKLNREEELEAILEETLNQMDMDLENESQNNLDNDFLEESNTSSSDNSEKENINNIEILPDENNVGKYLEKSDIKWLFVCGKGGVGKTTCSSSIAIKASKLREKVLIISTDPAHSLSDAFNQKFNNNECLVTGFDNLYCMEYDNQEGINQYHQELKQKMNMPNMFNPFQGMKDMFQNIPGIDEALGFLALIKKIEKMDYSLIIFDTAPTGHTLKLLSYPKVLQKSYNDILESPNGPMFRMFMNSCMNKNSNPMAAMGGMGFPMPNNQPGGEDKITEIMNRISRINDNLTNKDYTTFFCVSIPEFLSVYENERFIQKVLKLDINVTGVIINQVIDKDVCESPFWKKRYQMQQKYIETIYDLYQDDFIVNELKLKDDEVRGKEYLEDFI
jgi:arsenite/tail-anchored protein-transporting ATPase